MNGLDINVYVSTRDQPSWQLSILLSTNKSLLLLQSVAGAENLNVKLKIKWPFSSLYIEANRYNSDTPRAGIGIPALTGTKSIEILPHNTRTVDSFLFNSWPVSLVPHSLSLAAANFYVSCTTHVDFSPPPLWNTGNFPDSWNSFVRYTCRI